MLTDFSIQQTQSRQITFLGAATIPSKL